jgi:hypothetical protein
VARCDRSAVAISPARRLGRALRGLRGQWLRTAVENRLQGARERLTLPEAIGDIPSASRAVVAAYDGVTVQLLLDGDLPGARVWLTQLLTALLSR